MTGEKIAAFIDGVNMYGATKALNLDIDYKKLLPWLEKQGTLVRAFYYTPLADDDADYTPVRPLVDWLDYNGYAVVTKPAKESVDYAGRKKFKCNIGIDLAIDMMELAPHIDRIFLFSGDGDYTRLMDAVQRAGVRATVVSTLKGESPMIADELRRQADQFIDLDTLRGHITREKPAGKTEAGNTIPGARAA